MIDNDEFNNMVWAEKYRPKTLDDAILPESTKKLVSDSIANGNVPNLLLCGSAGTGKTTLARIIALTLDADLLFINSSLDTGIDAIRMKVIQFSSSVSFSGGTKFVCLDEADGMTTAAQQSLRGVIEEFPNTRFIFTCNFPNKIIDAIHSRCVKIDFKITKEEAPKLQTKFFKRVCEILDNEEVAYEKPVIAELIKKTYPDFRKTLNELQRYGSSGKIDAGVLLNSTEEQFKELVGYLKTKNFKEMRKWTGMNSDIDATHVLRHLFDMTSSQLHPKCVPDIIVMLAEYLHKAVWSTDPQITITAALTLFMINADFI